MFHYKFTLSSIMLDSYDFDIQGRLEHAKSLDMKLAQIGFIGGEWDYYLITTGYFWTIT